MLELESKLTLDEEAILAPNLCDRFSEEDLEKIGNYVYEGYSKDLRSRSKWATRYQAAMDLAMQVYREKTFPWPGCSNVAFPLITIAAMQSHSRAYSALLQGPQLVKCRVIGPDPDGSKTERARRISEHMSWQLLEGDPHWEELHDRLLLVLPIVGTAFKKTFFDAELGRPVSQLVFAQDLVVDYWARSIDDCPRKTHVIYLFQNDLHARIKRGIFRDVSNFPWYGKPPAVEPRPGQRDADNRKGTTPPEPDDTTPYTCLEQHVSLDLDQDGYAEPYVITIEESSRTVLRIVARFNRPEDILRNKDGEIISIHAHEYFTKYEFIPSPDGSIYGVGFGILLGPLNESVNSLINQLIDAGTMQATRGGFLSRGVKIRGGNVSFSPLQWVRVDSSGDDLRKNIVPLDVGEPSAVTFNLLVLLVNYVNRISATTDPLVGENPGQNTTAEATRTMVEQGMKIYNSIFKRIWRAMKEEFKKIYILNALFLPEGGTLASRHDYLGNPDDVAPAADPSIISEEMAINKAQLLKAAAATTPGYNPEEVERRFLKALRIEAPDLVYPGISQTGMPKDPKLQIAELRLQAEMAKLQAEQQRFLLELQEEVRMNDAQIAKIAADIDIARATLEGDVQDRRIALLNAVLGLIKTRNDVIIKRIEALLKAMEVNNAASDNRSPVRRLAQPPSDAGPAEDRATLTPGAPPGPMGVGGVH